MKRVGRSNKPGINKAAQAVGKNSQNILDAGALVIQCSSESSEIRKNGCKTTCTPQLPGGGGLYQ